MTKATIGILICLLPLAIFSQTSQINKAALQQLKQAFKERNNPLATAFFDRWAEAIPPYSSTFITSLDETTQEAYRIFAAFYHPRDLASIGGSEWGVSVYEGVRYAIVQQELEFEVVESFMLDTIVARQDVSNPEVPSMPGFTFIKKNNGLYDEVMISWGLGSASQGTSTVLTEFRPILNLGEVKTLFLAKDYAATLVSFLQNKQVRFGKDGLFKAARSRGKSAQRQAFLEPFIRIFYGHWGGYWQLLTYPEVNSIVIDQKMENAIVYFRMVYEGGEARLHKENGRWEVVEARRTWIE